jgi:hypothetical protein
VQEESLDVNDGPCCRYLSEALVSFLEKDLNCVHDVIIRTHAPKVIQYLTLSFLYIQRSIATHVEPLQHRHFFSDGAIEC